MILTERSDVFINHVTWEKWCLSGSHISIYCLVLCIIIVCIRFFKSLTLLLITCFIVFLLSKWVHVCFQPWIKSFKCIIKNYSNGLTCKWFWLNCSILFDSLGISAYAVGLLDLSSFSRIVHKMNVLGILLKFNLLI